MEYTMYELVTFEAVDSDTEELSAFYTTLELANAALLKRVAEGEDEMIMQIHPATLHG